MEVGHSLGHGAAQNLQLLPADDVSSQVFLEAGKGGEEKSQEETRCESEVVVVVLLTVGCE